MGKARKKKARKKKPKEKRLFDRDVLRVEETNFNPNYPHIDFSDERKVLEVALENEITGRKLYTQYAKTVKNEMARRVFVHLANEELNHIEDIKRFLRTLSMEIEPDVDSVVKPGSLDKTKSFFGQLVSDLKEQVRPSDDDNKSRQVAMRIEKAGFEYYRKGAQATKNKKMREFFRWLVEQEQTHYMLIQNAFEYANDPESWLAGEEHWLLEG